MTAPRVCGGCGKPELRTDKGVNLDPFTGYCVDCLIQYAREGRQAPAPRTFDARAAAARNDA